MLPACTKNGGESCPAPVISEVEYQPKNPEKSDDVTVTASILSAVSYTHLTLPTNREV